MLLDPQNGTSKNQAKLSESHQQTSESHPSNEAVDWEVGNQKDFATSTSLLKTRRLKTGNTELLSRETVRQSDVRAKRQSLTPAYNPELFAVAPGSGTPFHKPGQRAGNAKKDLQQRKPEPHEDTTQAARLPSVGHAQAESLMTRFPSWSVGG